MASTRRGGRWGLQTTELRGTLSTLLQTTLAQAGVVRDVIERGAREGRSRLDGALASRRRADALATLGEIVLDLIRRGEIDVDQLPEVRDVLARLDDLDRGAETSPTSERPAAAPQRPPASPAGRRFGHTSPADAAFDDDLANYMHPDDVPSKESR